MSECPWRSRRVIGANPSTALDRSLRPVRPKIEAWRAKLEGTRGMAFLGRGCFPSSDKESGKRCKLPRWGLGQPGDLERFIGLQSRSYSVDFADVKFVSVNFFSWGPSSRKPPQPNVSGGRVTRTPTGSAPVLKVTGMRRYSLGRWALPISGL